MRVHVKSHQSACCHLVDRVRNIQMWFLYFGKFLKIKSKTICRQFNGRRKIHGLSVADETCAFWPHKMAAISLLCASSSCCICLTTGAMANISHANEPAERERCKYFCMSLAHLHGNPCRPLTNFRHHSDGPVPEECDSWM